MPMRYPIVIAAAAILSSPDSAAPQLANNTGSASEFRLTVSREGARVVAPRLSPVTTPDPRNAPWSYVRITVPNSGLMIRAEIGTPARPRDRVAVCRSLSPYLDGCDSTRIAVSTEDGALVLDIRDSAAVSRLFGLRPSHARVFAGGNLRTIGGDSVQIEYVDPQLPPPDSAFNARYSHEVAERERLDRYVYFSVQALSDPFRRGPIVVRHGDSVAVAAHLNMCTHGCEVQQFRRGVSWIVQDSTVAELRMPGRPGAVTPLDTLSGSIWVFGRNVGETRVMAAGLAYEGPPARPAGTVFPSPLLTIPDTASILIRVIR